MLSISKSEFSVIGFLIRNFSKRFTIRSIASELKISAAGAHAALKKLEKNRAVKAERLGTGLFYEINLENKAARHLTSIALLSYFDVKQASADKLESESRAAISDGKIILVITNNTDRVKDICYRDLKNMEVICKNEEEFINALREKDKDVLGILEKGNVLFGEEIVIDGIKKVTR